jgi:hypothetical protein
MQRSEKTNHLKVHLDTQMEKAGREREEKLETAKAHFDHTNSELKSRKDKLDEIYAAEYRYNLKRAFDTLDKARTKCEGDHETSWVLEKNKPCWESRKWVDKELERANEYQCEIHKSSVILASAVKQLKESTDCFRDEFEKERQKVCDIRDETVDEANDDYDRIIFLNEALDPNCRTDQELFIREVIKLDQEAMVEVIVEKMFGDL